MVKSSRTGFTLQLSVPQLGRGEEPGAEMCRGQKVRVSPALPPPQLDSDTQPLPWSRGLSCILGVGPKGLASTKRCPEKPTLSLSPTWGLACTQTAQATTFHHTTGPSCLGPGTRPLCGAQWPGGQGQLI